MTASIDLDQVDVTFRVRYGGRIPLKQFVLSRLLGRSSGPVLEVNAIQGMNLSLRDGDRLGVVGHNGAGKSTLLKLLAGIYQPTGGTRRVTGRISSLFDVALGFEPDSTGWENIAYRSYLQGETPRTIRPKLQSIAEFSELGEFLDMPVRYYSSGMFVRLAFSIATAIEPEIFLVDEALGAGDMAFQRKVKTRIQEIVARARIMVLVSHDLASVAALCDRVIWLDHGRIVADGPAQEIVDRYKQQMQHQQTAPAGGGTTHTDALGHPIYNQKAA